MICKDGERWWYKIQLKLICKPVSKHKASLQNRQDLHKEGSQKVLAFEQQKAFHKCIKHVLDLLAEDAGKAINTRRSEQVWLRVHLLITSCVLTSQKEKNFPSLIPGPQTIPPYYLCLSKRNSCSNSIVGSLETCIETQKKFQSLKLKTKKLF